MISRADPPPSISPRFRGFGAFLLTQFLSAFDDNVHFFAISLYLTYSASSDTREAGIWQAIAGAAFVLPFILFSPIAGLLSDRHPKRTILIWAKWAETICLAVSFVSSSLPAPLRHKGLILGIFLMETRAAFFSPAKYGLLPEIVPPERLVRANGLLQMLTMVAIVSGEAIAGTALHGLGLSGTLGVGLGVAVLGSLGAHWIPPGSRGDPGRTLRLNPLAGVGSTVRAMKSDRVLLLTVGTLSSFWMVSAIFRSNMPLFGKEALNIRENQASLLMAFVSVGVGAGAGLAGMIRQIEASSGLILPGIIGMSFSSVAIGLWGRDFVVSGILLALLGVFGGLYLVPQTSIFQARSPDARRGEYAGFHNLANFTFMLLAAVLYFAMTGPLAMGPRGVFVAIGVGLALLGTLQCRLQPDLVLRAMGALKSKRGPRLATMGIATGDSTNVKAGPEGDILQSLQNGIETPNRPESLPDSAG